jgi:hypothetical protein
MTTSANIDYTAAAATVAGWTFPDALQSMAGSALAVRCMC